MWLSQSAPVDLKLRAGGSIWARFAEPEYLEMLRYPKEVLAPALNVVCVLVLARWGAGQGGGWRLALSSLLRNPIIWACGIGAALNLTGVPKPDLVMGVQR